jgi:tetratricopeptide (TPR) repeat protein
MKNLIVLISFSMFFNCFGQNGSYFGKPTDAYELCQYRVQAVNSFSSNLEAEKALELIVNAAGITKRFVLYQCNGIDNCEAITFRGIRYIFYDNKFMKSISAKTGSTWSNISILAHEVGHHVNAHSLDWLAIASGEIQDITLEEKRQQELEADEFSGFVMYKLGASLTQAQLAINTFCNDGDDSYSTHPNKTKRLNAIEKGYNNAKNQLVKYNGINFTAEDYFYFAYNSPENNYEYKIENYSKAIALDPKFSNAYNNRGSNYGKMGKIKEALIDFNKAIELNPKNSFAYYNRGKFYAETERYQEALLDNNKAIEIDPKYAMAYFNRGVTYDKLSKYKEAITDFSKAIQLDPAYPDSYYNLGTIYSGMGKFNDAIKEFTSAVFYDANNINAYYNRGLCYMNLGMYDETINDNSKILQLNPNFLNSYFMIGYSYGKLGRYDESMVQFNKLIELDPKYTMAYLNRGYVFMGLKKYQEAIVDFNNAIKLDESYTDAYFNRGASYASLGKYQEAIVDFSKTIELDSKFANAYYFRGLSKDFLGINACDDFKQGCQLGHSLSCEKYTEKKCK